MCRFSETSCLHIAQRSFLFSEMTVYCRPVFFKHDPWKKSERNKISCKRIFITSLQRFSFAEFTTFKNGVCSVAHILLYIRRKDKANETTPKQLRKNTVQIEHGLSSKMEIILFLWAFERSKETNFSGKYLNFLFCKIIEFSFQKQRFESIFSEETIFSDETFFLQKKWFV